jgi:hypothetical protein
MVSTDLNISCRIYRLLLLAYPRKFRQEFGGEMHQVFRDCYRDEAGSGSLIRFWLRTLVDLVLSAARERTDNSGRVDTSMNNLKKDLLAVFGCIAIIVISGLLLSYGRRNAVNSILLFGYALDAIVTTGVLGNLLLFILLKATRVNALRATLWVFGVVHIMLFLLVFLISRSDPGVNLPSTVIGYLVSFVFWTGLHWAWRLTVGSPLVGRSQ